MQIRGRHALVILLAALGASWFVWPGDTPWINDEPKLVSMALDCEETGSFVWAGLKGTRGIIYGPFPLWIYLALLRVAHDLVALVALRAGLFVVTVAVAIVWMARLSPRLRPVLCAL